MATASLPASITALLADPARATMLRALMAGPALTAGELARAAGTPAPVAGAHLSRLADGGLVSALGQGRHRYYRIASDEVVRTLEGMADLAAIASPRAPWRGGEALRNARTCWNHLAGRLGVALHTALLPDLVPVPGGRALSEAGARRLRGIGVDLARAHRSAHFCRDCMDWSERRPHLGGGLARGIATACFEHGWLRRGIGDGLARRCVTVTPEGAHALRQTLGITLQGTIAGTAP